MLSYKKLITAVLPVLHVPLCQGHMTLWNLLKILFVELKKAK